MTVVYRIAANIALFALAALAPWWLFAAGGLAAIAYFSNFFEIFIWSIAFDALFGAFSLGPYRIPLFATLVALVAFFAVRFIKLTSRA